MLFRSTHDCGERARPELGEELDHVQTVEGVRGRRGGTALGFELLDPLQQRARGRKAELPIHDEELQEVADRALVKDDIGQIRAKVAGWIADPMIDVVITTGGTGFTGRDVTPEAVRPLFEKEIDGFSTVFHIIS